MIPLMSTATSTAYFGDDGHTHLGTGNLLLFVAVGGGNALAPGTSFGFDDRALTTNPTNIRIGSSSPATATLPPAYVGGLTFIRAA
jgi:hypothetical protein